MEEELTKVLVVDTETSPEIFKGLSSESRIRILRLLYNHKLNINEIANELHLPQSTVATNIAILEKSGLVSSEIIKAKKGNQKICIAPYKEIVIRFSVNADHKKEDNIVEVEMPIGLYTNYHVSAPCGLCSAKEIIGFLDTPDSFLMPERMKAGLLWFETGYVEYTFPNDSLNQNREVQKIEISAEISPESLHTESDWSSDISCWINTKELGGFKAHGCFHDKPGKFTPSWWNRKSDAQYGLLKHWSVTDKGCFADDVKISDVKLSDLNLSSHHSIKVRIGVKEDAEHPGGINIFGRGFGNYDQAIVLRLFFNDQA